MITPAGGILNVSYSEVMARVYNATFIILDSDFNVSEKINKICLVNYNVFENERDVPNYIPHRVYYEELTPEVWQIFGVTDVI